MVDEMKAELILLRPKIDEKTEETQKLMIVLDEQKKIADEQAKITAVEEAAAQKLYNEVMVIKTDCEAELAKAMPIYKEALSALDTLNKNDIIEMKSYAKPSEDIVLVI
jgi:dynein heavy chain